MILSEVCEQVAARLLGKPGTMVECMVPSIFPDKTYGLVGETYEVKERVGCSLQLKNAGEVISTRFRIVLEDKCS